MLNLSVNVSKNKRAMEKMKSTQQKIILGIYIVFIKFTRCFIRVAWQFRFNRLGTNHNISASDFFPSLFFFCRLESLEYVSTLSYTKWSRGNFIHLYPNIPTSRNQSNPFIPCSQVIIISAVLLLLLTSNRLTLI